MPIHVRAVALLLLLACSGGGSIVEPGPGPDPVDPGPGPVDPGPTPNPNPPPPDPTAGLAASVVVIAGAAQRAGVGKELAEALVVRVSDAQDLAVPDQLVNFVVVSGGGSVFAGAAQTTAAGEARERWTLGTAAGEQVIEARAVDQTTGEPIVFAKITATADPGPVADLQVRNLGNYSLAVGDVLDLRNVIAYGRDQHNNMIWAADDVGQPFFGTFEDLAPGVTFWRGDEPGEPVETPGATFELREPFTGTVYVWSQGQRFGTFTLEVFARD